MIVSHAFTPHDLVGGHPVLDLANTVTARDATEPVDWLDSYARLIDWATLAYVLDAEEAVALRTTATAAPDEAESALAEARMLREAIHDAASALTEGAVPPLAAIERAWRAAAGRARLVAVASGVVVRHDVPASGLRLIADRIAIMAIDLLADLPPDRTRTCAGPNCGWLFIDTSKAGRRRWCDMATCGNAAKSRRHQARHAAPER